MLSDHAAKGRRLAGSVNTKEGEDLTFLDSKGCAFNSVESWDYSSVWLVVWLPICVITCVNLRRSITTNVVVVTDGWGSVISFHKIVDNENLIRVNYSLPIDIASVFSTINDVFDTISFFLDSRWLIIVILFRLDLAGFSKLAVFADHQEEHAHYGICSQLDEQNSEGSLRTIFAEWSDFSNLINGSLSYRIRLLQDVHGVSILSEEHAVK